MQTSPKPIREVECDRHTRGISGPMSPLPISGNSSRVPVLDGVRGVASIMVLIYHLVPNIISAPPGSSLAYIQRILSVGRTGVDLFFVLSGFLIAGILLDARESPHYFQTFYIRRICRIFPLYYALLVCYALLLAFVHTDLFGLLSHSPALLWYVPFGQNFAMALSIVKHRPTFWMGGIWMTATWSLAIEEQFYLALPLAIRVMPTRRVLVTITACLLALAPLIRWMLTARYGDNALLVSYVLPFTRMDALSMGVLLACASRSGVWERGRRYAPLAAGVSLFLTGVLFWRHEDMGILSYSVYSVLYGSLLILASGPGHNAWTALLANHVTRYLGKMSYSTYLFQLIALRLSFGWMQRHPRLSSGADLAPIGVALAVTLVLSALSLRYFEMPFMRLGQKYSY